MTHARLIELRLDAELAQRYDDKVLIDPAELLELIDGHTEAIE